MRAGGEIGEDFLPAKFQRISYMVHDQIRMHYHHCQKYCQCNCIISDFQTYIAGGASPFQPSSHYEPAYQLGYNTVALLRGILLN